MPEFNGAQAATSVPGPPSATSFPVIGAAGVKWEPPSANLDSPPESYVVMRQRDNGHWEDISGSIDPSIHHWIDTTLQPGERHQYYVVAKNELGTSQTSGIITATRPLQDPVTGSVNALTIDVNPEFNGFPLTNEVATTVTVGQPEGATRTLTAGDIQITLPALLEGPRTYYPVFRLRQGDVDCGVPDSAELTLTQLAYTANLEIALMTGWFSFWPCGADRKVVGEIRVNSTEPDEYCVSVRARDVYGNTSGWTAERCFSRPLDDRSLAAGTGWIRGTAAGLYYSTSTSSTRYDASLTRTVKMKRAYLLATKCSTCGVVAVYLGTRYLTTINLYAATTQRQVLIGIPAQTSAISGTLRIATRSTGKVVQIDGLAIRQT